MESVDDKELARKVRIVASEFRRAIDDAKQAGLTVDISEDFLDALSGVKSMPPQNFITISRKL